MENVEKQNVEPIELEIEVLEERIAPSVTGSGGYEGHSGNQSDGGGGGGYEGQPGNQSNG